MSHTNETPNYHLPQYVGTDIINPLVDTNDAYSAIDTALKDIADNEVADAGAIDALEATVGDNTAGLVKDVAGLQEQNGDSALTTDAQTLSAAINEVDAHTDTNTQNISTNAGNITDLQNAVGNVNSGLVKAVGDLQTQAGDSVLTTTAQTLSGAINELDGDIGNIYKMSGIGTVIGSVTADGVKTAQQLFKELADAVLAYAANLGESIVEITHFVYSGVGYYRCSTPYILNSSAAHFVADFDKTVVTASAGQIYKVNVNDAADTSTYYKLELNDTPAVTPVNLTSYVFADGATLAIIGTVYAK